jgi:prevent-host-death family protein
MIREAPAMTVRQSLGELHNEVQYRGDRNLITKSGKPVAALIDMALFERLRQLEEEFSAMTDELARAFEDLPETEGAALVDEAVRSARRKRAR